MTVIKVPFDAFKEVEKMLKYRFWDKGRERSNRAVAIASAAKGTRRRCFPVVEDGKGHARFTKVGPPFDAVKAYICINCGAAASEPEIKDMGYDFDTVPDWVMTAIMDEDLQRQAGANPTTFGGMGMDFGGKND